MLQSDRACAVITDIDFNSFTPIVTRRQLSLGKESGAAGAVFFSKKEGPVQNISDIRGKRIGVGVILGAYQRGFQVLRNQIESLPAVRFL
jgi:hypothetical protein